ncbi:TPM domain-containing protein [Pseudomonas sp. NY15437]|uniref:TPM domain-containing protein n=1 Tax=Pseudomonas sp. NY15437 TaxID=3400360 RepID=UPI003A86A5F8
MKHWIRLTLCLFIWLGSSAAFANVPSVAVSPTPLDASREPPFIEHHAQRVELPALKSPVTDLTGTLDSAWTTAMKQRLLALQQRKGSQIAILMLPSTGEDSIEQFATRVFEHWRLGRRGVDDGVLVLVAKDDHRMRIEVGYGLEGAIPDVVAARIIRENIVPAFRNGDFAGGIERAVSTLVRLIDGEVLPDVPSNNDLAGFVRLLLTLLAIPAVLYLLYRLIRRLQWRWIASSSSDAYSRGGSGDSGTSVGSGDSYSSSDSGFSGDGGSSGGGGDSESW